MLKEDDLITIRRHLHQIPEVALEEVETHAFLMQVIGMMDQKFLKILEPKELPTAILVRVQGSDPSRTIGYRTDIDGLPVDEKTGLPYASQHPGKMHACGHDTHITILLGAAKVLAAMKDQLTVTVRFLFQPAEEEIANSGAAYMKEEPLVKECDRLIALHIWSKIPAGWASLRYGPVMSAADTFDVTVEGRGGHGALPHQTVDPIVAGAEFVTALQTVVSREVNPLEPAVLSITQFQGGTTSNVIPGEAHLAGTARTFSKELRDAYPGILERVAQGVSTATRAKLRTCLLYTSPSPRD